MFLLNTGFKWDALTSIGEVDAAIFLASGNDAIRFRRRLPPNVRTLLFDPQLYLAGLDARVAGKVCSRLASHAWFMVKDVPEFDSGVHTQRTWNTHVKQISAKNWQAKCPTGSEVEAAARLAIEHQVEIGCSKLILPTPLLDQREDEGALLGEWLDAGIAAATDLDAGQPLLATVALSDVTLAAPAFAEHGFLDSLVAQVTARPEIVGVYVVVAQSGKPDHPFATPEPVLRAYLHLSRAFAAAGQQDIIVNFADVFGLVCMGWGATAMSLGPSQALRRLCLGSFRDDGGGISLPYFYSHPAICEFLTERDLGPMAQAGLLAQIADETPYSRPLLRALEAGMTAANLPDWAEGQNKTQTANAHFIARIITEVNALTAAPSRSESIRDWVLRARDRLDAFRATLGEGGLVGRAAPSSLWLRVMESVTGP